MWASITGGCFCLKCAVLHSAEDTMTLTDCDENACCHNMQPTLEAEGGGTGVALREAVWQAQEQGRLRCGVMECAQLLEIDPFNVMMCVMPVSGPDDVSGIIERTLIEAFCHEYQIRLIKVDSVNKLRKILKGRAGAMPRTPSSNPDTGLSPATPNPTARVPDSTSSTSGEWDMCSCVLLQYPGCRETSEEVEEEEAVGQYCKKSATVATQQDYNASAIVALPDD